MCCAIPEREAQASTHLNTLKLCHPSSVAGTTKKNSSKIFFIFFLLREEGGGRNGCVPSDRVLQVPQKKNNLSSVTVFTYSFAAPAMLQSQPPPPSSRSCLHIWTTRNWAYMPFTAPPPKVGGKP